jgi:nitroimidazol reductase NimA-like FMN-containing flavoprotein (pyridoxamine 5'-phosphate oxidase superfamily)
MLITKLRSGECRKLLARVGFGRLACVSNNRPYIVPIYFSYEAEFLYCFSTLGRKIEWMRENPLVCVEVDEIVAHDHWVSVVALGRYLEFSNSPKDAKGREYARSLIERRALWWQSGYTAVQVRRQRKPVVPVFYCIQIEEMTGLRASPDTREKTRTPRDTLLTRISHTKLKKAVASWHNSFVEKDSAKKEQQPYEHKV